jgi:hypothetical protein
MSAFSFTAHGLQSYNMLQDQNTSITITEVQVQTDSVEI